MRVDKCRRFNLAPGAALQLCLAPRYAYGLELEQPPGIHLHALQVAAFHNAQRRGTRLRLREEL